MGACLGFFMFFFVKRRLDFPDSRENTFYTLCVSVGWLGEVCSTMPYQLVVIINL